MEIGIAANRYSTIHTNICMPSAAVATQIREAELMIGQTG
jgi:hypothetical protein